MTRDAELESFVETIAQEYPDRNQIIFVCIGSDRSTGDAYGPIVGSMLKERGWPNIIGTLEQPCDAHAVEGAANAALNAAGSDHAIIIAVDACLGHPKSVGGYITSKGPLQPGQAIGRRLPPIGHFSIAGVVNMNGVKAYAMLQTTSLHHVMQMARRTVEAVERAWRRQ